ncbi:MAG: LCP family protein [Chroococcidiopsidaceae cyanobacterium CP_BM_RX_35]|nr:LCP family protein [Chroococcidiopsidaceae cyanobacterium CP_BM_RX_35]
MPVQKSPDLPPSSEPTDKSIQHKSNRAKSRSRLWWGLALTTVGLLSTIAGGLFAISFASKPLMQSQAQKQAGVFNSASISGTGLSFAQLTHPVNVLILGIDNDDNFDHPQLSTKSTSAQAFSNPSDTMLLVRFLPDTHQINVLSIPRDTLVHLPRISIAKIDWANLVGGAALAAQTVSQQIGGEIPIDRYVRLSRNGFIQLVDTLGGVEVTIPKRMDYVDETQHLNIHFLPGRQKLNGRHLEEYVRFRHDKLGDIGRVQRQQEVLKAIMQTLLQPATLAKLPQILQVAQSNIDTDLSVQEILTLVQVTLTTDRERNNFLMLPGRFSRPGEYTRSYWIEDRQAAAPILARYFNASSNPGLSEAASAVSSPSRLRVAVANATGQPEAGKRAVAFLRKQGFSHVYITEHEVDTSAESALKTQIIAQHGNPEAASAVQSALGLGQVQVTATGDVWSDVTVVIGADFPTQHYQ